MYPHRKVYSFRTEQRIPLITRNDLKAQILDTIPLFNSIKSLSFYLVQEMEFSVLQSNLKRLISLDLELKD